MVAGHQFRRQFRGQAIRTPGQNPRTGWLRDLGGTLGHDHAFVQNLGRIGFVNAQDFGFPKARIAKGMTPHGGADQGVMRSV